MNEEPNEKLLYIHINSLYCVIGVIPVLIIINLYFSLDLDFCNVSTYTFEKLLESIKIALKVA